MSAVQAVKAEPGFRDERSAFVKAVLEPEDARLKCHNKPIPTLVGATILVSGQSQTSNNQFLFDVSGATLPWNAPPLNSSALINDLRPRLREMFARERPTIDCIVTQEGHPKHLHYRDSALKFSGSKFERYLRAGGLTPNDVRIVGNSLLAYAQIHSSEANKIVSNLANLTTFLEMPFLHAPYLAHGENSQSASYRKSVDDRYFVAEGDRAAAIFDTRDVAGNDLPPHEWRRVWDGQLPPSLTEAGPAAKYVSLFYDNRGTPIDGTNSFVHLDAGKLFVVDPAGNGRLTIPSKNYRVDPANPGNLLVLSPDGTLHRLDLHRLEAGFSAMTKEISLPPSTSEVNTSKDGTYIYCIHSIADGGRHGTFEMRERMGGAIVGSISGIWPSLSVSSDDQIFFGDGNYVRRISTNLSSLTTDRLKELRHSEAGHVAALVDGLSGIALAPLGPALREKSATEQTDEAIAKGQHKILDLFRDPIAAATDLHVCELVRKRMDDLASRPQYAPYPNLFDAARTLLDDRERTLRIEDLVTRIDGLANDVTSCGSARDLQRVQRHARSLREARDVLAIEEPADRERLRHSFDSLAVAFSTVAEALSFDLPARLQAFLSRVTDDLKVADTLGEVELVRQSDAYREYRELLDLVSDATSYERGRIDLTTVVDARIAAIERSTNEREVAAAVENERLRRRAFETVDEIEQALAGVSSPDGLERWRRDTRLYADLARQLEHAPEAVTNAATDKATRLFRDREAELVSRARTSIGEGGPTFTLAGKTFTTFPPHSLMFEPQVIPQVRGERQGKLVFAVGPGFHFDTGEIDVPMDRTNSRTQELIARYRPEAEAYFNNYDPHVRSYRGTWVFSPFVEEKLAELAENLEIVRRLQQGFLVVEADAGAGKNILFDMFSHFSRRPLFDFSCNNKTQSEDLKHSFHYDPTRGTYRVPSLLPEALQTPGAIVLLDEMNTLPDAAMQDFHPATDYRRTFNLSPTEQIKIDPTVVIAASVNPQHYVGVRKFTEALLSRALFMEYGYPTELIDTKKTGYEAHIYSRRIDCLRGLSDREFYGLWNLLINGQPGGNAGHLLTPERESALRGLDSIVSVAHGARIAYRESMAGSARQKADYVFSIREGEWISAFMNEGYSPALALRKVVLPKVRGAQQKERIDALITQKC